MPTNALAFTLTSHASSSTRPLELAASESCPSRLICWTEASTIPEQSSTSHSLSKQTGFPSGVALCCTDGTLFLFRSLQGPGRIEVTAPPPSYSVEQSRSPSPMRYSGLGISRARSSSPASPSFAFFQPSKSRIVSGVSTEQVEAPKTSVDYDEEPEKLKDLLKGKGRKDRTSVESRSPVDNSNAVDSASSTPKVHRSQTQRSNSRTLFSSTLSTTSSIVSLDSPPSTTRSSISQSLEGSVVGSLSLICHIFPPSGPSQDITAIQAMDGCRYLACLRRSG